MLNAPASYYEGCAVPLTASGRQVTTMSIHSGRGQCIDPPVQSFGRVELDLYGIGPDSASDLSASFRSGPALQPPASTSVSPPGSYQMGNLNPFSPPRTCAIANRKTLSPGTVRISNFGGSARLTNITETPQPLPTGFSGPGFYSVSATGGDIAFSGPFVVGPPFQLQPVANVKYPQPVTLNWTGGDSNELVRVRLIRQTTQQYAEIVVPATQGSRYLSVDCSGYHPPLCSLTFLGDGGFEARIDVFPVSNSIPVIPSQGVTQDVQLLWVWKYQIPS